MRHIEIQGTNGIAMQSRRGHRLKSILRRCNATGKRLSSYLDTCPLWAWKGAFISSDEAGTTYWLFFITLLRSVLVSKKGDSQQSLSTFTRRFLHAKHPFRDFVWLIRCLGRVCGLDIGGKGEVGTGDA